MNGDLVSTTTIRQRGQLTIPGKLRKKSHWLSEGSVVAILSSLEEEIKVVPYKARTERIDWRQVWDKIKLARSFKGEKGNLSEFIFKDRISH